MIEVRDRVPTYPGRVKLTPVTGLENVYVMTRADEPTEPGTPINRALFESVRDDVIMLTKRTDIPRRTDVTFNSDGSITETIDTGHTDTVFNADGSISEYKYVGDALFSTTTTIFNGDGSITTLVVDAEVIE